VEDIVTASIKSPTAYKKAKNDEIISEIELNPSRTFVEVRFICGSKSPISIIDIASCEADEKKTAGISTVESERYPITKRGPLNTIPAQTAFKI